MAGLKKKIQRKTYSEYILIFLTLFCVDLLLDIIFNPKFAVPIFSRCKTIFVVHGMEWYVYPEAYKWYYIIYVKFTLPLYCRKADTIIAVSTLAKSDILNYIGINEDKIRIVYEAANKIFRPMNNQNTLVTIKEKYNLPDRFIIEKFAWFFTWNVG